MKKIISIFLCVTLFVATMFSTNIFSANTRENNIEWESTASPITFERSDSAGGYVDVRDGEFRIVGRNSSGSDVLTYTKGLTDYKLSEYTLKYVLTPYSIKWSRDMVLVHTSNHDKPDTSSCYVVSLQGHGQISGDTKPTLIIAKNATVFNSQPDVAKGAWIRQVDVSANKSYNMEIKVRGATISVWLYKVGNDKPSSPTLTWTDPNNTYTSGYVAFGGRTNGCGINNITLTNDADGVAPADKFICDNYSPVIYNSDVWKADSSFTHIQTSGSVSYRTNGYRIYSKSLYDGVDRPIITSAVPTATGEGFEDFELKLDYTTNLDTGTNKILFNSVGTDTGYSLSVSSNGTAILSENATELSNKSFSFIKDTTYRIEIERKETTIKIWIYEKSGEKPAEPLISYTEDILLASGNLYFYTANGDFTVANIYLKTPKVENIPADLGDADLYTGSKLRFVQKSADGYMDIRDGKLVLTGKYINPSNGKQADTWVETMGLTGEDLTDFTIKYKFTSAHNNYGNDVLIIRGNDSATNFRSSGYTFGIQGYKNYQDENGNFINNSYGIYIQKGSVSGVKETTLASLDGAFVTDLPFKKGIEYNVEVSVSGYTVSAWVYEANAQKPTEPTITFTDSKSKYSSGDIGFASRCEGYSVRDIVIEGNTKDGSSYSASSEFNLYNGKTYVGANSSKTESLQTGSVSVVWDSVKLSAWSTYFKDYYTVKTPLVYKSGKYIKNFDLGFIYDATEDNIGSVIFNSREIGSEYTLVYMREGSKLNLKLKKDNSELASKSIKIKDRVKLQFILSRADNKFNLYVYKNGSKQPTEATMAVTLESPLPSGQMYFSVDKGSYSLSDVKLRVNDSSAVSEPIYELNFEDGTMGDAVLEIGTGEIKTENGNKYLHLEKDQKGDGTVKMLFGPSSVSNFTLNMEIRTTVLQNPTWHWVSIKFHASGSDYYETQIFPKGTDIAAVNKALGYKNTNKKLGLSGTADPRSGNPNHSSDYGLTPDDDWHKVSIVSDGFEYSVYIDGVLKLKTSDPERLYEKGGFILGGWGACYDIDNIKIYTETYYDLADDIVREGPIGIIFEKDFEGDGYNMDGITLTMGNNEFETTTVMTEEDGNKFLRCFGDKPHSINANTVLSFGPKNVRDFELTAKIRVKAAFNVGFSYVSVGIHALPTSPRWNTVWMNMGPKGSAVAIINADAKLDTRNLVAMTGMNTTASTTDVMPTDNREFGLRPDGRWHDIKVTVKGNTYTLYVDGKKYISYTDKNPFYTKGRTTLCAYGANFDVDDIVLSNFK